MSCADVHRQTASAVPVRPSRRAAEELGAALRLLARAVAALVAGHLGPAAARLPPDWSPFACLAGERLLLLRGPCRLQDWALKAAVGCSALADVLRCQR